MSLRFSFRIGKRSKKNPPTPLVGAGRAIGALAVELCILALLGEAFLFARGYGWAAGPLGKAVWKYSLG